MTSYLQKKIALLFFAILFIASLNNCSPEEIISNKPKKKKSTSGGETQDPTPEPKLYSPSRISDSRLVRRLTIDMLHRLPEQHQIDHILVNEESYLSLVENFLSSNTYAKALAKSHLKIWGLENSRLADLDRFADTDSTLSTALTESTKKNIREEPTLLLRYLIQEDKPLTNLFTSPWTISHKSALSVWGANSTDIPWVGEPYRFYQYTDKRPDAGIISSRGLHSIIDTEQRTDRNHAAYQLLNKFFCMDFSSIEAHTFSSLSEDELKLDFNEVAKTKKECAGCHLHLENISPDISGFTQGENISTWLSYTNNFEQDKSYYSGKQYSKMSELAQAMSKDPRFHTCEIKRLFSSILQRPISSEDYIRISSMYREYKNKNYNLKDALKQLYLSETYASNIQDKNVNAKIKNKHSGVKYLNNIQLESIMNQISNISSLLKFPSELSPGGNQITEVKSNSVSGQYFHALKKFSFTAAKAIVADELANNISAPSRKIFSNLPDGDGYTTSDDVINSQIISTWFKLTSNTISSTDQIFVDLKTLWNAGFTEGTTNADKNRNAWKILLIGMFLSPDFISY